jgi:hypothetical protein
MKLKNLTIKLNEAWTNDPGKYSGTVQWEDKKETEIKMVLPQEISEKLLLFLAPVLEEHARTAAARMADSIVLSVQEAKQLPEVNV